MFKLNSGAPMVKFYVAICLSTICLMQDVAEAQVTRAEAQRRLDEARNASKRRKAVVANSESLEDRKSLNELKDSYEAFKYHLDRLHEAYRYLTVECGNDLLQFSATKANDEIKIEQIRLANGKKLQAKIKPITEFTRDYYNDSGEDRVNFAYNASGADALNGSFLSKLGWRPQFRYTMDGKFYEPSMALERTYSRTLIVDIANGKISASRWSDGYLSYYGPIGDRTHSIVKYVDGSASANTDFGLRGFYDDSHEGEWDKLNGITKRQFDLYVGGKLSKLVPMIRECPLAQP